jgi:adenosylmethionine-8-amino-7-oxononanoate aminotransferase
MYNKEKTLEVDRKHIWHPFTQMKDYENSDHVVMSRGKGVKLYDIDGNEYYDTISSWWTNTLGHTNERLGEAIKSQLDILEHVNFSGFTHPFAAEFIDKLNSLTHESLTKYFFSDDGSTSVEVALKMAFQYFQNLGERKKSRFVMLENAYHGDTLGTVSVGGVDLFHHLYSPLLFDTFKTKSPNCSCCPHRMSEFTMDAKDTGCDLQCFSDMETLLREKKEEIAGVIVEPLFQGAGGMLMYPPQYLNRLRSLTCELDILLIYDEVATGFGRTGTMFAYEQTNSVPDIICLSKGITAGYMPFAVTATTDTIFNAFYDDYSTYKTFYHGHSFTGNPLACSVAIENLNILKEENLPESNIDVSKHLKNRLAEFSSCDYINDIRHLGFIGALDIVKSKEKGITFHPDDRIGKAIYEESLKHGLVLRPLGDMIYLLLPLIVTKEDVDEIVDRTRKVLEKVINEYS